MFKKLALAAAVMSVAGVASVANVTLTPDSNGHNLSDGSFVKFATTGAFADVWTLVLTKESDVSFGFQQNFAIASQKIGNFSAAFTFAGPNNTFALTSVPKQQNLAWVGHLQAGTYTVNVQGNGVRNMSYTGNVTVTPVPEPETYALMLAGLGAVGFVARRRKAA